MKLSYIYSWKTLEEKMKDRKVYGCGNCLAQLSEDDKAYVLMTAKCPHCEKLLDKVTVV